MIFQDKTILVTGGTGSMGKKLVHRVLSGELGTPHKVIVLSRDEAKQHEMRMSYLHRRVTTDEVIFNNFVNVLEFRIGDVRSFDDVCAAVQRADIVINCVGAYNIVRAIQELDYPVHTVVGISTDKACKPVNVMGMSKSIQERILVAANILNTRTRFICVRYGNVLASRASVIPLFHDQIRGGGPVTITVPEMTRFLLSLDDAVDTVFTALREARRGETYVPNAPSATVLNIAKTLIGTRPIELKVVGIRPGEKMHEIMISEEEVHHCVRRGNYYAIRPMLPELRAQAGAEPNALAREFSSADTVLDLPQTVALLEKHKLMLEDVGVADQEELL